MVLEADTLPFGPVILNSFLSKKLKMDNVGDVPCRIHWEVIERDDAKSSGGTSNASLVRRCGFIFSPVDAVVPAQGSLS